jgi:hypothetical protein
MGAARGVRWNVLYKDAERAGVSRLANVNMS